MVKNVAFWTCAVVWTTLVIQGALGQSCHTRVAYGDCNDPQTACDEKPLESCSGFAMYSYWGPFKCENAGEAETQCAGSLCETAPCFINVECIQILHATPEGGVWKCGDGDEVDEGAGSINEDYD